MGDFALILQKAAKPGSMVKKGEVVAEFDRQMQLLRLDDYKASVVTSDAALGKLNADLQVTKKNHEQSIAVAKASYDKAELDMKTLPVMSAMDSERIKLSREETSAKYKQVLGERRLMDVSLAAQIRSSEIELAQSKLELRRAEMNVDRMVLKAPIDGLVVMQTIPRGSELAQVQEGDQLYPGMMFMSIVDTRSMIVNAVVNQVDVEHLRIGARAHVHFDAYPDLTMNAKVYSVGGIPRTGGQRFNYVKEIPIKLKLEGIDPRVIPDLSVSVDVITESETQQASIAPLGAIFEETAGHPFVFVQGPAGWSRRPVELGLESFTQVVVRSGLQPREVVALERPPEGPPQQSQ
jgi:multidrug efflux pump subunit AcrA (membrane-fusion protein)